MEDLLLKAARRYERVSTVEEISRMLREAVISGEIPQGTQLREVQLAKSFGVGRGVVREALREFVVEGLATHEVHRGIFVKMITPADVLDIYVARLAVEVQAMQLIVDSDREVDAAVIEEKVARMRRLARPRMTARQVREAYALDLGIHQALVELSGSPRLMRMYRTILAEMHLYFNNVEVFEPRYVEMHEELLAAIKRRDASSVEHVRLHLQGTMESLAKQAVTTPS